jgi:hypothetical protein
MDDDFNEQPRQMLIFRGTGTESDAYYTNAVVVFQPKKHVVGENVENAVCGTGRVRACKNFLCCQKHVGTFASPT